MSAWFCASDLCKCAPLGNKLSGERNAGDEVQDERVLLDVVVGQSATILKLFACEDKALPVRKNTTSKDNG